MTGNPHAAPAAQDHLRCSGCSSSPELLQRCHRCGLWLCPRCWGEWNALACRTCRAILAAGSNVVPFRRRRVAK